MSWLEPKFVEVTPDMVQLSCGCYFKPRRAALLNWLLSHKLTGLYDLIHGSSPRLRKKEETSSE
jgi:hypothetical protein